MRRPPLGGMICRSLMRGEKGGTVSDGRLLAWMLGAVLAEWAIVGVNEWVASLSRKYRDVLGLMVWCAFCDAVMCWALIVGRWLLTTFGWLE